MIQEAFLSGVAVLFASEGQALGSVFMQHKGPKGRVVVIFASFQKFLRM